MITAEKRGRKYYAYFYERGHRLRGALGTRSRDFALRLVHIHLCGENFSRFFPSAHIRASLGMGELNLNSCQRGKT